MGSDDGKKKVLTSAPPPRHTIVLLILYSFIFVATLPSLEKLNEAATMESFTNILFPEYMDLYTLAFIRLVIAMTAWGWSIEMIFISNGWVQETPYPKQSKLIRAPIKMSGIRTMFPFTSVAWNLLGLSFSLSSYIALKAAQGETVSPWILRLGLCAWEVAAPFSVLVAAVIRYAIWPKVLAEGDTTNLKSLRNVFLHNINVFYCVSECALLGGLPVRWTELSFSPLVGIVYVIFSWNMTMNWNKECGPQFIYFFFDTTIPGYGTSDALLALLAALVLFFAIFCSCNSILQWANGGLVGGIVFVVGMCSVTMRFRD